MTLPMTPTILYEDQDLLAINKPSGLVVNRATSVKEVTVQDWWAEQLGAQAMSETFWLQDQSYQALIPVDFVSEFGQPLEIWRERLGIVHRLDKDTSGVLLLAKNPGALLNLLAQFKKRQTKKTYFTLVHGHLTEKSGQIIAPMSRNPHNRLKFMVDNDGKTAVTHYVVKQEFAGLSDATLEQVAQISRVKLKKVKELYQAGFSLLEVEPQTGRTHQIRVHLSAMQHPVVGDALYVGRKRAKLDQVWCARQFLHALSIEFTQPRSGEPIRIEAPLADDLRVVLVSQLLR